MAKNNDPPRRSQPFLDTLKAIKALKRSPLWQQQQEAIAKLRASFSQGLPPLDREKFRSGTPEEIERRKALLSGPPELAELARQARELEDELELMTEQQPAEQLIEQAAEQSSTDMSASSTAAESTERIETDVWWANWVKTNPRREDEDGRAYAKRGYEAMRTAPVTSRWNEEGCRRALYPRPKVVDFAPEPGSMQTFPKQK